MKNNYTYFMFPKFNPILFSIGPLSIHWYGIMYLISLIFAFFYSKYIYKKIKTNLNRTEIIDLLYFGFLSMLIGGRLGYIIFYNNKHIYNDIFYIFKIWNGGMSFHGGLIGVITFLYLYSCKNKKSFLNISDFFVPIIPLGIALGRVGNFINGELWGRIQTNISWAMLFPSAIQEDLIASENNPQLKYIFLKFGMLPRHPSQIYEFILEGIILFIIMNIFIQTPKPVGSISALFLIMYGIFRFIIEFFREPDPQIGLFLNNTISMGQILSIPMIIIGIYLIYKTFLKK